MAGSKQPPIADQGSEQNDHVGKPTPPVATPGTVSVADSASMGHGYQSDSLQFIGPAARTT